MYEFVIRTNIARFEALLAEPLDDRRRRSVETLLEAERAKLAALPSRDDPGPGAFRADLDQGRAEGPEENWS